MRLLRRRGDLGGFFFEEVPFCGRINGVLGGLVSITASANIVSPDYALLIGAIGGIVVNVSTIFLDKVLKADDPVGAIPVHGFCGVWGIIAVALFIPQHLLSDMNIRRMDLLGVQALGSLVAFIWSFGMGFLIFFTIKHTIGIRATPEEENIGLNVAEHCARNILLETASSMSKVADERGDLTIRVNAETGDEAGEIGILFNKVLDRLHDVVLKFKNFSNEISFTTTNLMSKVKDNKLTIKKMVTSMENINEKTFVHDHKIQVTNKNLHEIVETINTLANNTRNQAEHVVESSSAITQMVSSIQSVANMANKAYEISKNLTNTAKVGSNALIAEQKAIKEIEQSSHQVAKIVKMINDVADKTNVLALNASIEAQRAGSAGRGFSVVASEIRKLSHSTSYNASTITDIINIITQKINKAFLTSEKSETSLQMILKDIGDISEINTKIANATQEQLISSKEILLSVQYLTEITDNIKESLDEEAKYSSKISDTIKELVNIAHNIRLSIENQLGNSKNILTSINEVGKITENNNYIAINLGKLINEFKLYDNNNKNINNDDITDIKPL